MSNIDRSWMYGRHTDGIMNPEFIEGVDQFIAYACTQPECMFGSKIRCPCRKCDNRSYAEPDVVDRHLVRKGFVPQYYVWHLHGESYLTTLDESVGDNQTLSHVPTCEPTSSSSSTGQSVAPEMDKMWVQMQDKLAEQDLLEYEEQERLRTERNQAYAQKRESLITENERVLTKGEMMLAEQRRTYQQMLEENLQRFEGEMREMMQQKLRGLLATQAPAPPRPPSNPNDSPHDNI